MTTKKLHPIAINAAKQEQDKIRLDACTLEETKHRVWSSQNNEFPTLQETVGFDTEFFFLIEHAGEVESGQVGVGVLKEDKNEVFLERKEIIYYFSENRKFPPRNPNVAENFPYDAKLTVCTFTPYMEEIYSLENPHLWYSRGVVELNKKGLLNWNGDTISIDTPDKFKFNSLRLTPSKTRPRRAAKGTIVFNDITGDFEGYDGKNWRSLSWKEEE